MAAKLMTLLDKARVNRVLRRLGLQIIDCYYDYYWYRVQSKIDLKKVPNFSKIAESVIRSGTTLLAYDRLYTIWQAVTAIESSKYPLAEIGTYKGGSARFIAESLRQSGKNNPFFVFDTFEGHVIVDESIDGPHGVGNCFTDTSFEKVKSYLSTFGNVSVIKGDFMKTSDVLNGNGPFTLVHIDVDVYPVTKYCLAFFRNKMVRGGTIIVDDYGFLTCKGAKKAVDEFMAGNMEFRMLHLLTGQALLIKTG